MRFIQVVSLRSGAMCIFTDLKYSAVRIYHSLLNHSMADDILGVFSLVHSNYISKNILKCIFLLEIDIVCI